MPICSPDPALQAIADHWEAVYAPYVGHALPPPWQMKAGIESGPLPGGAYADTFPVNASGHYSGTGPFCRIRVAKGVPANSTNVSFDLAHEVFHCFEDVADDDATGEPDWMIEGMAQWAALSVDHDWNTPQGINAIADYMSDPTKSLFSRDYDAAGFWDHVASEANLWHAFPSVLAASSSVAAFDTATGLASTMLGTWGSSGFNEPSPAAPTAYWRLESPEPPYESDPTPIDHSTALGAPPYATNQYRFAPAASPTLIELKVSGPALLSAEFDDSDLADTWLCAGGACVCPPGTQGTPPPHIYINPGKDSDLGLSAGAGPTTGRVSYHSLSEYCQPMPNPAQSGDGGDQAADGGDPHLVDFHGDFYDFQGDGDFTLLESKRDNLQIQGREQQVPRSQVAVITEIALRDADATVEVDAAGSSAVRVYVNRRLVHSSRRLTGGGSLTVARASATVRWPDGTQAQISDSLKGPSFSSLVSSLEVSITVTKQRFNELTGLLGDAGGPARDEFASRGGRLFPASEIVGASTRYLYGAFGASWRVQTFKQSLFRSTTREQLRPVAFPGVNLFAEILELFVRNLGRYDRAAQTCAKGHVAAGGALDACIVDVDETGDDAFVGGDQQLAAAGTQDVEQEQAALQQSQQPSGPGTQLPAAPILPTPIALGPGTSAPAIAYSPASADTYVAWMDDTTIEECTLVAGGTSCANGGPQALTAPNAGAGAHYDSPHVLVLDGNPVVVADVYGANAAMDPSGYSGVSEGTVAWSASSPGGALAIDGNGKFLAAQDDSGDPPSGGAVALDSTHVAVLGNAYPFGSGFTDFTLTTPAPKSAPTADSTGNYGDQEETNGEQLATTADAGQDLVVAVGGSDASPLGCPAGTMEATGYGAALGSASSLTMQAAWSSSYFEPISCEGFSPVLAGGSGGVGLLESEGQALEGTGGPVGVYYRPFNTGTMSFSATPVLVSDETAVSLGGADDLDLTQDKNGGLYASWSDERGQVVFYSGDGGASWSTPAIDPAIGPEHPAVVGFGGGASALALLNQGEEELQPMPTL